MRWVLASYDRRPASPAHAACILPLLWLAICGAAHCHAQPPDESMSSATEWEIVFDDGITTEEYARQIDFFQIEIGALSKSGKVEYITHVAKPKPDKRVQELRYDRRWRITWKSGNLHVADRKLLGKAGINSDNKEMWHFFPDEVHARMVSLERSYAGTPPHDIRRTRFGVRATKAGDGYEFFVVEQEPPKNAPANSSPRSSQRN